MPYPVRLKGGRSGKANLRQEAKLYELVDGVLKRGGLPVLREADMEAEVEKIHGRFGQGHNHGIRKLEQRMRERWHCIGLRTKLEKLCRVRCFQCHMLAEAVWFRTTVSKFVPVDANKGRMICSQSELQYVGVPTVEFAVPFRLPVNVEAIPANGNCVFSVLCGIGANSKDHGKLRQAVFSYGKGRDQIILESYIWGELR